MNRLRFTGQLWKLHPTVGIDWDLYTIAGEDQQAHIGNWAHAWHPSPEQGQFRKANGRPFEERQHILRVLTETMWQRGMAADILGIHRTTLANKIREYDLANA